MEFKKHKLMLAKVDKLRADKLEEHKVARLAELADLRDTVQAKYKAEMQKIADMEERILDLKFLEAKEGCRSEY